MQELPRSKRVAALVPALFVSARSVHESVQGGSCRGSGPGDVRNGRGIAACSLAPPGVRLLAPSPGLLPQHCGRGGRRNSAASPVSHALEKSQTRAQAGWPVVRLSLGGVVVGQLFFSHLALEARSCTPHHLPSNGTNGSHMESPSSDVASTAAPTCKWLSTAAVSRARSQDVSGGITDLSLSMPSGMFTCEPTRPQTPRQRIPQSARFRGRFRCAADGMRSRWSNKTQPGLRSIIRQAFIHHGRLRF